MNYWNSSLDAILRGAPVPAQLRNLQDAITDQIRTLRQNISIAYQGSPSPLFHEQLLADGPATLVIMGERGSGKSTLLVSLVSELARDGVDLVLPIMRPELFSANDSVISSFLASLWERLAVDRNDERSSHGTARSGTGGQASGHDIDADVIRLLADTSRSQAASNTTLAALENATDGPIDFAEDSISVSRSRIRLPRQIHKLARELCLPSDGQPERLIIVPIDDPDLAPAHVRPILRDLRVLGSVPGILPIACLCPSDLKDAWVHDTEARWSGTDVRRMTRNYEQEIQKIFPFRSRFTIEPPTAQQRINFTPVTSTETLATKFRVFRETIELEQNTKWPIDEALTYADAQFGLPNPLPANPRSLVQLWESLEVFESTSLPPGQATIITVRRMLELLTERIRAWCLPFLSESLYEIGSHQYVEETDSTEKTRYALSMSLEQLRLFISAYGSFESDTASSDLPGRPRSTPLGNISLRPLHHVKASIIRPRPPTGNLGTSQGRSDNREREDMPPAEVSSLLALQEIAYGSMAFDVYGAQLYIGQSEWSFLQRVTLGRLATDNNFVLLPEAATLSEIRCVGILWNELVKLSKEAASTDYLLANVVAAACSFVERKCTIDVSTDYETAFARATLLYVEHRADLGLTSKSFCQWYEVDLPFHWHNAFFSSERIRAFCHRHHEARANESSRPNAEAQPVVAFDARIERIVAGIDDEGTADERCWAAGYFDLAAALGSSLLGDLNTLYPRWRERCASILAGTMASEFVSAGNGIRRLAPYPTPGGQQLLDEAIDLLRRMRAAVGPRS